MDLTWIGKSRSELPVGEEEFSWFTDQISGINTRVAQTVELRRSQSDNARFCKWAGQSADARKYREYLQEEPFPFQGCSDQKVPLCDMIVNEDVALCFLAGLSAMMQPQVRMTEGTDAAKSAMLEMLLRWQVQTQIGVEAVRELLLLLNYMLGDVPGVAVLETTWVRDPSVVLERLTMAEVLQRIDAMTGNAMHPDTGEVASVFLARALQTPGLMDQGEELLAVVLMPLGVDVSEIPKMVKELTTKGETDFPMEYVRKDRVQLRALRAFEDVWWDATRRGDDDVDIWFRPRWMTRRECLAAAKREEWDADFLKKLCGDGDRDKGKPGQSLFPDKTLVTMENIFTSGYNSPLQHHHETEYETTVVTYRATDKRGRTGWYWTTVAAGVDVPAHAARLLAYKHGCSPYQVFQAEYLRPNMVDTRGVPARFEGFQWALKLELDMHNDRTQLTTVPPLIGPESRIGTFRMAPGGYIPEGRPGEFRFMPLPAGGARDAESHLAMLWQMVNEYAGRSGAGVPDDLVTLLKQGKVTAFLGQLSETMKRVLQLSCQYVTPDRAMRLLNVSEDPLPRTVQEIQGSYDCALWLDARDLTDTQHLTEVAKTMVTAIVQLDRNGTIDTTPWAQALAQRLDPRLAAMSMSSPQAALDKEMEEEKAAFVAIQGGVEPKALEGPNYNYMARLQELRQLETENAEDIAQNWTERKRQILAKHRKNLTFGLQEQENAETGRTGVKAGVEQ